MLDTLNRAKTDFWITEQNLLRRCWWWSCIATFFQQMYTLSSTISTVFRLLLYESRSFCLQTVWPNHSLLDILCLFLTLHILRSLIDLTLLNNIPKTLARAQIPPARFLLFFSPIISNRIWDYAVGYVTTTAAGAVKLEMSMAMLSNVAYAHVDAEKSVFALTTTKFESMQWLFSSREMQIGCEHVHFFLAKQWFFVTGSPW